MKTSKKTVVNFILDKSGSMSNVCDVTVSGFNEYVGTLRKDSKSKYEFTLTLFDTAVVRPYVAVTLDEVKDLTKNSYKPDGNTALYDAVCKTIRECSPKKGDKVITIIMTDGQENSSKEYNETHMRDLIKERESKGNWTFVYLGANQDSYAIAAHYGINVMNITNFNATQRGVGGSFVTAATNTVNFAQSAGFSTQNFFTKEDQDKLDSTK